MWLGTEVEDHRGRVTSKLWILDMNFGRRVGCAVVGIQWETEAQGDLRRWMSADSG